MIHGFTAGNPDVSVRDDDGDSQGGSVDSHDDEDYGFADGHGPQPLQIDTAVWEGFINELRDLSSMQAPDISAILDALPVPEERFVNGMSVQEAVQVLCCNHVHSYTMIWHDVMY